MRRTCSSRCSGFAPGLAFLAALALGCADYGADPSLILGLTQGGASNGPVVQSGLATVSSTLVQVSLASAVDTSKAFVVCTQSLASSAPTNFSTCKLSGSSTVDIESNAANNQIVSYFVVQSSGVNSVQRGSAALSAATSILNVPITNVDTTRSIAIVTSRLNSTTTSIDEQRTIAGRLTSGTNLRLGRTESGTAVDVEWQVVEWSSVASVQSNFSAVGGSTANIAITALNTAQSFLMFSVAGDTSSNGIDNQIYVRGSISASNTITFSRQSALNTVNIAWYVVELSDGTTVQRGSASANAAYTNTPPLTAALTTVDTARSIAFGSADILDTGNATSTSDQDSANFHFDFQDASTIRMTRQSVEAPRPANLEWEVVQFAN